MKKQLGIGQMFMRMVKNFFRNKNLMNFSFLGPTSEPDCDAAVSNLVEMGFDEVMK